MDRELLILETATIKETLKRLDRTGERALAVVDVDDRLVGAITDGDIRRHILQSKSLDSSIEDVFNRQPIFLERDEVSSDLVHDLVARHRVTLIPLVNRYHQVVEFAAWVEQPTGRTAASTVVSGPSLPVVIMAGGKGSRLDPYTRIFPKPLIPLGDKTIVETIIDQFRKYGSNTYFLTLNHKGKMIESYFDAIDHDIDLRYVWEEEFLGTAGGLKLLQDQLDETFIVSNCDILVQADYHDVLSFHRREGAALTVLSSMQHFRIPYGVVEFKEGGEVTAVTEKPEYTFPVNTGVYILERECLDLIPSRTYYDMPFLIGDLMDAGQKVIMYPVNENDYIDIGQWDEFKKATEKLATFADG